ncbi:MAG TPA: FecR family protein, partial [bacterium]|nr:FecR family protein [bacterium]
LMILATVGISTSPAQESGNANVVSVSGEASMQMPPATEWQAVEAGASLPQGTQIRTEPAASVLIEFKPGHRSQIAGGSFVTLSELSYAEEQGPEKTTVDLAVGKILSNVKKLRTTNSEYSVRTPTASAAVRGTVYEVVYDPGTRHTQVKVLEGLIHLESRIGTRLSGEINEREKSGVDASGALSPSEPMSEQETNEMQQASQQAVTSQAGTSEVQGQTGQLDATQSEVTGRLEEIQERLSEENRANRIDSLREIDDDDD